MRFLKIFLNLSIIVATCSNVLGSEKENKRNIKAHWHKEFHKDGRKVKMTHITPGKPLEKTKTTPTNTSVSPENVKLKGKPLFLSVSVFDEKWSRIQFIDPQDQAKRKATVWSNTNWILLQGIGALEVGDTVYDLFIAFDDVDTKSMNHQELVKFRSQLASARKQLTKAQKEYVVTSNHANKVPEEFLDAIHSHYREKNAELQKRHNERKVLQAIRLRKNKQLAGKKKDIKIEFWDNRNQK